MMTAMGTGKLSDLAIVCAAMALPICSASALDKAVPAQPAPAPKAEEKAPQLSKAQTERIDDFVLANLAFITLHEMGHALISEFELRIPGREEETADRFAAYMMVQSQPMEELFKDAIIGWFARADQKKPEENDLWSRHNTDIQRAVNAVCLLYGTDPRRFKSLADEYKMASEARKPCNDDATNNGQTWFEALLAEGYVIAGTAETRARIPPAGSEFMTIEYNQSKNFKAERDLLIKSGLLEETRNGFRRNFVIESGIKLTAEECGEANAFWLKSARKLTICYELVRQYREIAVVAANKK